MQSLSIIRESPIIITARTLQMCGLFDLEKRKSIREEWKVDLKLPEKWNIGLIVGPSGSGKSTLIETLWKDRITKNWEWDKQKSIVDSFPKDMSIKNVCALLCSVGFSSPPSWLKPFHVLSNGEQFRVSLARTLSEQKELSVIDEYSSVVDRTVAKIGSAAFSKTVRKNKKKVILCSCHYDIIDWLQPDWIYQPEKNKLSKERLRRPKIKLKIYRVKRMAWKTFSKYHYLNNEIHKGAQCFCAFWGDVPVAFASAIHFPHPKYPNTKREHRTVCLPDYQGVGIGNALSDWMASLYSRLGSRYLSITSHPSMIYSRARSKNWRLISKPTMMTKTMSKISLSGKGSGSSGGIATRLRATFEYIGPKMSEEEARICVV